MLVILLYLAFARSLAHGISNKEHFIKDVLESGQVDMCDFGYAYAYDEHKKTKTANQIIATITER